MIIAFPELGWITGGALDGPGCEAIDSGRLPGGQQTP